MEIEISEDIEQAILLTLKLCDSVMVYYEVENEEPELYEEGDRELLKRGIVKVSMALVRFITDLESQYMNEKISIAGMFFLRELSKGNLSAQNIVLFLESKQFFVNRLVLLDANRRFVSSKNFLLEVFKKAS